MVPALIAGGALRGVKPIVAAASRATTRRTLVIDMKLIFLNRFFFPDHSATSQILSDLAFGLAQQGRNVVIVTSRQRYDDPSVKLAKRESARGVEIHRVWTTHFGRSNLAGRAIDYLTFYLSAAWRTFRLASRGDVVVAKTDPPLVSILAVPIARWRGASAINWLQDIFPEVAENLGVGKGRASSYLYRVLRALRDRSLRRASTNVVLGDVMAERIAGRGVTPDKIKIIPNWSDTELVRPVDRADNALRTAWGLQDAFVVGYSGNLGRAHEYQTFLDAIAELESNVSPTPVKWLFIGGGALMEDFKAEIARRGLTSVVMKPYQPREKLAESLSVADVHLVSLRPEMEGLIVPSKFYGVAAAGRPTIFIGSDHGEIARLARTFDCGVTVPPGDSAKLVQAIIAMAADADGTSAMGRNARTLCEDRFDKRHAIEAWLALLDTCGASRTI